MPRRKIKSSRPAGRPPFDPLQIYLWVTAGAQLKNVSIDAFCNEHALAVVRGGRSLPTWSLVQGYLRRGTLKRRYYEAKKALLPEWTVPEHAVNWPPSPYAKLLDGLVEEMKIAMRGPFSAQ